MREIRTSGLMSGDRKRNLIGYRVGPRLYYDQSDLPAFQVIQVYCCPKWGHLVLQDCSLGGECQFVGLGSVWLSNLRAGNVWRLDPRRIQATVAR